MGITRPLLAALGAATSVLAHGHVNYIVVAGVKYDAYDVSKLPYMSNPPVVVIASLSYVHTLSSLLSVQQPPSDHSD